MEYLLTALIISYSLYIKWLIASELADGKRIKALAKHEQHSTSVKDIFFKGNRLC